ncbi:MAG: secretin N-terminal domain-containing protein [Pseudomonadota bacterium]
MKKTAWNSAVIACTAMVMFGASGCSVFDTPAIRDYSAERAVRDDVWSIDAPPATVTAVAQAPQPVSVEDEPLYSFVARDLPISQACKLFGKAYDLNIVVEPDVSGSVNVELTDLPFAEVMESMLGASGYYWERRGNIVFIKSWQTRSFAIDYIRLVRSGSGTSLAQVSSGGQAGGQGGGVGGGGGGVGGGVGAAGGAGGAAGQMSIQQEDKVDFWAELEEQLAQLVSDDGRLVVNRLSGTVQVTDQHRRVEEIDRYITELNNAIYRQVDIQVKIVEVTLNDDSSLGVDWSRLVRNGDGEFVQGSLSTIVLTPAGGLPSLPPTGNVTFLDIENGLNRITAVVQALEEQGKVDIVSQPHIRTLNNQSALVKVGTDRTFFRKEQSTDRTAGGSQTFATDIPQVVTEGIVLSITPQIASNGWITLDVSPVVTRVSSVSEVIDSNGVVQSAAPNLDISQASSLVRARSGETIVIGGLIQSQQTEARRAVPLLGRLPIVGRLFQSKYQIETKKELIMMLTPRLIPTR